ncbi:MAG: isoamylase early set domain-containing protein [Deltaproteobacteria bacterium]|nr:isoamylase early set domain-containing protein [Deltaproteobacteria bacterium]
MKPAPDSTRSARALEAALAAALEDGAEISVELGAALSEQLAVRQLLCDLPPATPSTDLTAAVLAALPERPGGLFHTFTRGLTAPRRLTLRWNLASAVTAVALFTAVALSHFWPGTPAAATRTVTLVFVAPQAKSVTVAGDFNAWHKTAMPLANERGDGVWVGTLELLPGHYEYMFVVDGVSWVPDPLARVRRPDGFGNENAVIEL